MSASIAVRVPASSANLGAGFDVLAMALDEWLFLGVGPPPSDAQAVDDHHPAARAFVAAGDGSPRTSSSEPIWLRSAIPMGRGLGFSGAARVAGAALAVAVDAVRNGGGAELEARRSEVLDVAATLEGHGDNAAASTFGGVVAWVSGRALPLRLGPQLRSTSGCVPAPGAGGCREVVPPLRCCVMPQRQRPLRQHFPSPATPRCCASPATVCS